MLRHVLMFRLKPDATAEARKLLVEQLHVMQEKIPELLNMSCGQDAHVAGPEFDNPDVIAIMDFENVDTWRAYLVHPDHDFFADEYLLPILEKTTGVQFYQDAPTYQDAL
jgi:hypothetical protein